MVWEVMGESRTDLRHCQSEKMPRETVKCLRWEISRCQMSHVKESEIMQIRVSKDSLGFRGVNQERGESHFPFQPTPRSQVIGGTSVPRSLCANELRRAWAHGLLLQLFLTFSPSGL